MRSKKGEARYSSFHGGNRSTACRLIPQTTKEDVVRLTEIKKVPCGTTMRLCRRWCNHIDLLGTSTTDFHEMVNSIRSDGIVDTLDLIVCIVLSRLLINHETEDRKEEHSACRKG